MGRDNMTVGEFRKVKKLLDNFDFWEITETNAKLNNTYQVELLDIWQDNGIAGFCDYGNVIENLDNSIAKGFLLTSAVLILYKDQCNITLRDGTISIKGIN